MSRSVQDVPASPLQRLADLLLGRPVLDLIAEERTNGKTWPEIRDAICDATNGEIDVTWQAIQQWARAARTADVA